MPQFTYKTHEESPKLSSMERDQDSEIDEISDRVHVNRNFPSPNVGQHGIFASKEMELVNAIRDKMPMYTEFREKGFNYEELLLDKSMIFELRGELRELLSDEQLRNPSEKQMAKRVIEWTAKLLEAATDKLLNVSPKGGVEKNAVMKLGKILQAMTATLMKSIMAITAQSIMESEISEKANPSQQDIGMPAERMPDFSTEGGNKAAAIPSNISEKPASKAFRQMKAQLLRNLREASKEMKKAEIDLKNEAESWSKSKNSIKQDIRDIASFMLSAVIEFKSIISKKATLEKAGSVAWSLITTPRYLRYLAPKHIENLENNVAKLYFRVGEEIIPKKVVELREKSVPWIKTIKKEAVSNVEIFLNHRFGKGSGEKAKWAGELRVAASPLLEAMKKCLDRSSELQLASAGLERATPWPTKNPLDKAANEITEEQTIREADAQAVFSGAAEAVYEAVLEVKREADKMQKTLEQMSRQHEGKEEKVETFKKLFSGAEQEFQHAGTELVDSIMAMAKHVGEIRRTEFWKARAHMDVAIYDASAAMNSTGLAITKVTERSLNTLSRDMRIAKDLGMFFAQQKKAFEEENPHANPLQFDNLVEKIAQEVVAQDFIKDADPEGSVMAGRVVQSYGQARVGTIVLPPTAGDVLKKTQTLQEYLASTGTRTLMGQLTFAMVDKSWDRLISHLPRNLIPNLSILKVIAAPITFWVAAKELSETVMPGYARPEKELKELMWRHVTKAALRVLKFVVPRVVKLGVSAGLGAYAAYRHGVSGFAQMALKEVPGDAALALGWEGANATSLVLMNPAKSAVDDEKRSHSERVHKSDISSGNNPDVVSFPEEETDQDEQRISGRGKRATDKQDFDALADLLIKSGGSAGALIDTRLNEICEKWKVDPKVMDEKAVILTYRDGPTALHDAHSSRWAGFPKQFTPEENKGPRDRHIRVSPRDMATGNYIILIDNAYKGGKWSLVHHEIIWPNTIPPGMRKELEGDVFGVMLKALKALQYNGRGKDDGRLHRLVGRANKLKRTIVGIRYVRWIAGIYSEELKDTLNDILHFGDTLCIQVGGRKYELSNCFIYRGKVYFNPIDGEKAIISLHLLEYHLGQNSLSEKFRTLLLRGMRESDLQALSSGFDDPRDAIFNKERIGERPKISIDWGSALSEWMGDRIVDHAKDFLGSSIYTAHDIRSKIWARYGSATVQAAAALFADSAGAKATIAIAAAARVPDIVEVALRDNPNGKADDLLKIAKEGTIDVATVMVGRYLKAIYTNGGKEPVSNAIRSAIDKTKKTFSTIASKGTAPIASENFKIDSLIDKIGTGSHDERTAIVYLIFSIRGVSDSDSGIHPVVSVTTSHGGGGRDSKGSRTIQDAPVAKTSSEQPPVVPSKQPAPSDELRHINPWRM